MFACGNGEEIPRTEYQGYAQGTTWRVVILNEEVPELDDELHQLFLDVDASLSIYVNESTISQFNHSEQGSKTDPDLIKMLDKSVEIHQRTGGSFDPTVGPVVRAWGFHREDYQMLDSATVDSLKARIGMEKISYNDSMIFKETPGVELDLNGIAQGYTVDLITKLLEAKGITRYLVEVGGEVRTAGLNQNDTPWRIGIDHPLSEERTFSAIVGISDQSLATSGNYRKFFIDEVSGQKFAHTIDPQSAYPVRNNLLSVSVVTRSCTDADAYATAFMVMGVEGTRAWLMENTEMEMEVYLIFSGKDGRIKEWSTEGFDQLIAD
jgi:thiamine biosynthesis lipoprotein